MKKYFTGIIPVFTLVLTLTYFYAWMRLAEGTLSALFLAIPFVLVWMIPVRFWSTDHSSYKKFDQLLHILGYISMGVVNFLFVTLLLTDLVSLLSGSNFIQNFYPFIVLGLTSLALISGIIRAHFGPPIREVDLIFPELPENLDGLKIVQISDLHIGPTIKQNYVKKVVEKTLALSPNLIVLTGDIVDGKFSHLEADAEPLKLLAQTQNAYFIMGNHDYYSDAKQWLGFFNRMGMKILLNAHDHISFEETSVMVAGVTDPAAFMAGHPAPDPKAAMRTHYQNKSGESSFKILLAHNPKLAPASEEAGFNLMLSGHTHAGQFFPWTLIVRKVHSPHYWGESVEGKMRVYVSAGTGTWGPPIRLGTRTELTHITLKKS